MTSTLLAAYDPIWAWLWIIPLVLIGLAFQWVFLRSAVHAGTLRALEDHEAQLARRAHEAERAALRADAGASDLPAPRSTGRRLTVMRVLVGLFLAALAYLIARGR